jgi:hypothetical protein
MGVALPVRIAVVDLLVSQTVDALNVPASASVPMGIAECASDARPLGQLAVEHGCAQSSQQRQRPFRG